MAKQISWDDKEVEDKEIEFEDYEDEISDQERLENEWDRAQDSKMDWKRENAEEEE